MDGGCGFVSTNREVQAGPVGTLLRPAPACAPRARSKRCSPDAGPGGVFDQYRHDQQMAMVK